MKATLISKYMEINNNAGHKAPSDVEKIFSKKYGATKRIVFINIKYIRSIEAIIRSIVYGLLNSTKDRCIIVQWPLYTSWPANDIMVCKFANKKIALIHDLDSLRFFPEFNSVIKKEISQLNKFDAVITHNKKMTKWLCDNGLNTKTIELNCFDYLSENEPRNVSNVKNKQYSICYAGNLVKAEFIKKLIRISKSDILLYGNRPDYKLPVNVRYLGSFSSEEICRVLDGDFGLIWDGPEINNCIGKNGEYTRYNNPHKMSLYITCGIPIIAWSQSAIAEFIIKNNIGCVVDSLTDLDKTLEAIDITKYMKMVENTRILREKVINGQFTIDAINKALELV